MVLSLTTISNFYGGLPDSIREQTGSVNEYHDNFIEYTKSVHVFDPDIWLPCFILGLKFEIYREVFWKKPKSLLEAWFFARSSELRIEDQKQEEQANSEANLEKSYDAEEKLNPEIHSNKAPNVETPAIQQSIQHPQPKNSFQNSTIRNQKFVSTLTGQDPTSATDSQIQVEEKSYGIEEEEIELYSKKLDLRKFILQSEQHQHANSLTVDLLSHDGASNGTEVGVFVARKEEVQGAPEFATCSRHPRTSGEWLHHRRDYSIGRLRRVPPIVATPLKLLAAVFPWHRESRIQTRMKQEEVAVVAMDTPIGYTHEAGTCGGTCGGRCASRWGAIGEDTRMRVEGVSATRKKEEIAWNFWLCKLDKDSGHAIEDGWSWKIARKKEVEASMVSSSNNARKGKEKELNKAWTTHTLSKLNGSIVKLGQAQSESSLGTKVNVFSMYQPKKIFQENGSEIEFGQLMVQVHIKQ